MRRRYGGVLAQRGHDHDVERDAHYQRPREHDGRRSVADDARGAAAVAGVLLRERPVKGYTGIPIPGYRPRKALQRIIDGEHRQHPDYERNRLRRLEVEKSKARSA